MGTLVLLLGLGAVFAALVLAVAVIAQGARERAQLRSSLATVGEFHVTGPRAPQPQNLPFNERVAAPAFERAVSLGRKITPGDRAGAYRRRIELAGVAETWDVNRVLAFKAIGLVVGIPAAWLLSLVLGTGGLWTIVALAIGGVVGYFGVDLWLYNTAQHRQDEIRKTLPDAMDMMTIAVESGLSFDGALSEVARNTTGPLSQEAFRTLQEMQIGVGRGEALENWAARCEVDSLNAFVSSVVQADKYGVPIAQVLRVQSNEMRVKRRQAAEEKAQKVPVKLVFPLALCVLPAMFIVILGPAGISIYENLVR